MLWGARWGRCGLFAWGFAFEVYGFSGVLGFHSFTRRGIMRLICWLFASLYCIGDREVLIVLYILSRGTLEFALFRDRGVYLASSGIMVWG